MTTVIALLGAEALPAWSTATIVTELGPSTSVYVMVCVPTGMTSLITPFTLTSYSMPGAGPSSVEADQRSHSSSGHEPLPPSDALSSVGLVGATVSELACVVAATTLLSCDTLPDGSIALTLNW